MQDYLCNRLYGLPEAGIEKYLSQLCQLLVSRNFASLERVLIALCAKSLRIAVKVRQLYSYDLTHRFAALDKLVFLLYHLLNAVY